MTNIIKERVPDYLVLCNNKNEAPIKKICKSF